MGLNEADTRAKLIDPALHGLGWTEDLIRRETTAGTIEIINGTPKRKKGRTDYLLCLPVKAGENPLAIAVLEAKKEDEHAKLGLGQAKEYAKSLNVPFVFSTNGHLFVEYDSFDEKVGEELRLESFPKPELLKKLYEAGRGFSLEDEGAKPLCIPYRGGQSERRYYQDATIRAALEKIAGKKEGWNRVLLSLATGSGKTRIAVQLLHKLAEAGHLRKALFVCDRNELRKQGFGQMFSVFGDNADFVVNKDPKKNARIIVATYQALGIDEDGDQSFFLQNYPENYFSHIIIDECHRSAWDKWSIVLTNNPDAVQIGLTATPRKITGEKSPEKDKDEKISRNNIRYFGEPVYEYPYAKGWEDGYLAACEIVKRSPSIDERPIMRDELLEKGVSDAKTGELLGTSDVKDVYSKEDLDRQLILPDRRKAMCKDLLEQFEKTGGVKQKTIIFCVNDKHAEDVEIELNNISYEGELILDEICYLDLTREELKQHKLKINDLLFNRTNSADLVGKTTVFDKKDTFVAVSYLVVATPKTPEISSKFVSFYLNMSEMKKYFVENCDKAISQANFSASKLCNIEIPAPDIDIQNEIVSSIQSAKNELSQTKEAIKTQLNTINQLPSSILNEVFGQYQIQSS